MSIWRYIYQSLFFHWRVNLAVALSVAAATAVLTGALLVGDSVRGSLRALTLDRLGRIDEILIVDRFFRRELVDALRADERFQAEYSAAVALIAFPQATIERQGGGTTARAAGVLVVGCESSFWELDNRGLRPDPLPQDGEIVLNQPVADELQVSVGGSVVLRLPKSDQVPADSPLASKSDRIRNVVLRVVDILPASGLGHFSLTASQQLSRNVFVSLPTLQQALGQPDRINGIAVSGNSGEQPPDGAASKQLAAALQPAVADLGISIDRVRRSFPAGDEGSLVYDYFQLTTDRMILAPETEAVARRAFDELGGQGVMTYLANSITVVNGEEADPQAEIPYSMVSAIDLGDGFPLDDDAGERIAPLADDEIVLNRWAANDLDAVVGDTIELKFYAPETTHGQAVETSGRFRLKAITPLTEPSQPYRDRRGREREAVYTARPVLANDPRLTPEVPGVTDQETIADWDPPFPFDGTRVQGEDDAYWENHRTTPKAFVSLSAGEQHWGSRFGRLTSYRLPFREGLDRNALAARFEDARGEEDFGMRFRPVKRLQLAASRGTTPFDGLFLGLSFFIIAAALLLVALLFRLGVEQHAGELAVLLATGMRHRRVACLLVAEGAVVAAAGAVLGVIIGMGYARLMVEGLRTWWVGAITTPFLEFYYTPLKLVIGYGSGVVVSVLAIAWSVRQLQRVSVRRLLAGQVADAQSQVGTRSARWSSISVLFVVAAVGLSAAATRLAGMAQAGAFFGAGTLLLAALLLAIWNRMRRPPRHEQPQLVAPAALGKLSLRNVARNPGRSALTIGLMASACFLIVAMSSFRLEPSAAGTGGFDLVAESADPIFADFHSAAGRSDALAEKVTQLDGAALFGLRLRGGDDASCNNLYKAAEPRVIGVTPELVDWFDDPQVQHFAWAATASESPQEKSNPWQLLAGGPTPADQPIPVVIDMNTAMYSLGLPPGTGSEYVADYDGTPVRFRVVGLLSNSLLQGSLLISEADFKRQFPEIGGDRYFLIRSPAGRSAEIAGLLEERYGDQGLDAVASERILQQLLQVQNTYLSTFQSLGALGLLLGTFGLAAVQLRNIVERRGELALLRACGFRDRRVAGMIFYENIVLLVTGLGVGCLAACLVVLPHKLLGEAAIPLALLRDLALMLAVILIVGVVSSLWAMWASLRAPVLPALRGD